MDKINKRFWEICKEEYLEICSRNNSKFYLCGSITFRSQWRFNVPFFGARSKIKRLAKKFLKKRDYNVAILDSILFSAPEIADCEYPNGKIRLDFLDWCIKRYEKS